MILFCEPLLQCCLLYVPIVHEIEVEAFSHKCFSEHRDQLLVVGLFLEFQFPCVVQKVLEFFGVTFAKIFDACDRLLDFDLLVFLLFGLGWETLPWQRAANEVHQDYSYLLQVVSPRLLDAQVSIETGIPGCTCEGLVVFE